MHDSFMCLAVASYTLLYGDPFPLCAPPPPSSVPTPPPFTPFWPLCAPPPTSSVPHSPSLYFLLAPLCAPPPPPLFPLPLPLLPSGPSVLPLPPPLFPTPPPSTSFWPLSVLPLPLLCSHSPSLYFLLAPLCAPPYPSPLSGMTMHWTCTRASCGRNPRVQRSGGERWPCSRHKETLIEP